MATRPHSTTEDQMAALGNVKRKAMQIDLLSGEISDRAPKRGNGSHVKLKPLGIERPAVPGMASWAGSGPEGKRCQDCAYLGAVSIAHPGGETESSSSACLQYAKRTGHLPTVRYDITLCAACDQFDESQPHKPKSWHIRANGEVG